MGIEKRVKPTMNQMPEAKQKTPVIDWARIKSLVVEDCTLIVVYDGGNRDQIKFANKAEMLAILENRQRDRESAAVGR